jgi:hypothetical protein
MRRLHVRSRLQESQGRDAVMHGRSINSFAVTHDRVCKAHFSNARESLAGQRPPHGDVCWITYAHTSDMHTPRAHRSTCQPQRKPAPVDRTPPTIFMDLHVSPFLQRRVETAHSMQYPRTYEYSYSFVSFSSVRTERTMASAITERPNPLTMGLGSSTAAEVVHLLCQTDAQMFAGWGGHPGLSDDIVLQVCDHIHTHIHTCALMHALLCLSLSTLTVDSSVTDAPHHNH